MRIQVSLRVNFSCIIAWHFASQGKLSPAVKWSALCRTGKNYYNWQNLELSWNWMVYLFCQSMYWCLLLSLWTININISSHELLINLCWTKICWRQKFFKGPFHYIPFSVFYKCLDFIITSIDPPEGVQKIKEERMGFTIKWLWPLFTLQGSMYVDIILTLD